MTQSSSPTPGSGILSEAEAVLIELAGHVQQLSRISQDMAVAMADLEPSLAYPQAYTAASEADLREQVRRIEPQIAASRDAWSLHRSRASHAQLRRATDLIRRAEHLCDGLRPVEVQPCGGSPRAARWNFPAARGVISASAGGDA